MPDIIHLLPDSVANQIAAGEVIQRPASAVKELLENSVDSGADSITLIVKDAGKSLVQVIDNGCGMSETDARMCFERHATSKIKEANDLFSIHTLGFRGEAMASIAAIAQVELKSRRKEEELGTCLHIEGSEVISQEICSPPAGTSISVKNLFFNLPARRKFLKSNNTEIRHIIEEFQRVALVYPQIKFSLFVQNKQLFKLDNSGLKQRIAALFNPTFNNRLIPIENESSLATIKGFIGKPEFAKKTRGEQYFFVNGRFIRHPYLNHAVSGAFEELLPKDAFPTYFIYFTLDPSEIDINIHPTKTEVNFENNKMIYAFLASSVKQALGKFNIAPSIDFSIERTMDIAPLPRNTDIKVPQIKTNPDYNPFDNPTGKPMGSGFTGRPTTSGNWEKLYEGLDTEQLDLSFKQNEKTIAEDKGDLTETEKGISNQMGFQVHNKYLLSSVRSGLMLIDQQRAHERILFEHYTEILNNRKGSSQQLLFPVTMQVSPGDAAIIQELLEDLMVLGFNMEGFGENSFIINGSPVELNNEGIQNVLEKIIENYKKNLQDIGRDRRIDLARSMAVNMAIKQGKNLQQDEINSMIDQLFACKMPQVSPDGKPIVHIITLEKLADLFK
ncbi:MAG: DNA mismatch repair endonuclease MutL [Bacteroidetes bacterium]|nr:MAG: DNA mismatch repair endonuclease MutL [Bacteroidota bacterium]